jgi:hypothetical protein
MQALENKIDLDTDIFELSSELRQGEPAKLPRLLRFTTASRTEGPFCETDFVTRISGYRPLNEKASFPTYAISKSNFNPSIIPET